MSLLETLLESFGPGPEDMVDQLDVMADIPEIDFFDGYLGHNNLNDQEIIDRISEQYGFSIPESKDFMEVVQAIQHSVAKLDDVELLSKIDDYVDDFNSDPKRIGGLINNVKGLYGEHKVYDILNDMYGDNIQVIRDYATNAPGVDLRVFNSETGELLDKIQVKVTSSKKYVLEAMEKADPDVTFIVTDEVAQEIAAEAGEIPNRLVSMGMSNAEITGQVERVINILSNTEPEFDVLVTDPIISEHIAEFDKNPFAA